ncbi:MAG: hypothetical protein IK016_04195 [Lachnospiraceae bacterium]|nr:hypothetical protein [Lachnospiraceae bacterium]
MNGRRRQRRKMFLLYTAFFVSLAALIISIALFFTIQNRLPQPSTVAADKTQQLLVRQPQESDVQGDAFATPERPSFDTIVSGDVIPSNTDQASEDEEPTLYFQTPAAAAGEDYQPDLSYLPEELRTSRESAGLTSERIAEIKGMTAGRYYYYDCLNSEEQTLYAELYHIIITLAEDVFISATDAQTLEKVQNCVMNDHPEIYYLSGYYTTRYTLGEQTVGFSFTGRYLYDAAEISRRNLLIEDYITRCLSSLPAYADDYTKVKYVYDYLIRNTAYDIDASDNQNICSVMIGGKSVCQGYAKAAQMLLNRAHVDCTLVVGTVTSGMSAGPHAWNLVYADGNWYYLDVTWGDASFRNGNSVNEGVNYDYLLTTTAEISKTHTIGSVVPMPLCNHTEDNYYIRERAYFTEASLEAFGDLVARRMSEGAPAVTFKCSDAVVYDLMITQLVDESKIFDYIHKSPGESLSFTRSDDHLSFTVWF